MPLLPLACLSSGLRCSDECFPYFLRVGRTGLEVDWVHARRGEIRNFTLLSYFGVPRVLLLSLDMWCQRRARFQNDGGWPKRMLSSTSGQDAIMKPHSPIEVRRRRAGLMPAAVSLGEEEREKERERPLLCHFGSSREWSKAAASRQKRASKPTGLQA